MTDRNKEVRAYLLQQPLATKVRISKRGECFVRHGSYWVFHGMIENVIDMMDEHQRDELAATSDAATAGSGSARSA